MKKIEKEESKAYSVVIILICLLILGVIMFLGLMGSRGSAMVSPLQVEAKQCKSLNSECQINDSEHSCCAGLSCLNGQGGYKCRTTTTPTHTPTPTPRHTSTPTPTVTPTSTPIPSVTLTPTPTPFEEECDGKCEEVTPTPTPEVTPEPVCTGNCGTPPTFAGSSTNAPQCGSTAPQSVENPHVYRKGDVAVVKWYPKDGNMVHIYYKQVASPDWQYSVTVPNTGYYEIKGLGTLDISFAVQAVNDCSGGTSVMSKVIVDGPTEGWVLFR